MARALIELIDDERPGHLGEVITNLLEMPDHPDGREVKDGERMCKEYADLLTRAQKMAVVVMISIVKDPNIENRVYKLEDCAKYDNFHKEDEDCEGKFKPSGETKSAFSHLMAKFRNRNK